MKPQTTKRGYKCVNLYHNKKSHTITIHRLVAIAFIPNDLNLPQVNHKKPVKSMNIISNLEWVSNKENIDHARRHGLFESITGSNCHFSKYTENDIHKVCDMLENKVKISKISKTTGVSKPVIYSILENTRWRTISSQYNIDTDYYKKNFMVFDDITRNKILELINNGIYIPREICDILSLPYTNRNRDSIKNMIKKHKEGSTTIENTNKYYIID